MKAGYYAASAGEGRLFVKVSLHVMEDSISAEITGGEKPHVGCVILALPGESARSLLVEGHRDHDLALPLAEELCRLTGFTVSMSAGIHIDRAESAEIAALLANAREAFDKVMGD
ncbi:MAG: hypothetical protein FWG92_05510 [Leptospirales bacterium]|nr:hypothetical protein [Leptospirales bacterium]